MQPSHSPLPSPGYGNDLLCLLLLILQLILLAARRTPSPNISMVISLFCSEASHDPLLPVNKTGSWHLNAPKSIPTLPFQAHSFLLFFPDFQTAHVSFTQSLPTTSWDATMALCDQENSAHLSNSPHLATSMLLVAPMCIWSFPVSDTTDLWTSHLHSTHSTLGNDYRRAVGFVSTVREWDLCEQGGLTWFLMASYMVHACPLAGWLFNKYT